MSASLLILAALPNWLSPVDLAISLGTFAAVALLLVAVFSQSGEITASPERQVALETGHSDRRTVFERPLLGGLMWLLLSMAHRLALPRLKQWVRTKLMATGNPNFYTGEEYLALAMLSGLVLAMLLQVAHLLVSGSFSLVFLAVGLVVGFGLSLYQLHNTAAKRVAKINRRVPYVLDLIALAMGAGATFTEAVRTVVRRQGEDPFNDELRSTLAEMELGSTRRKALMNLAQRVPLDSLRSIIASVVQAEELGTPLSQVLHEQATLLRLQRSVRAENAAAVASVRILLPCLLLVLAVLLTIFGPAVVRALQGGLF